MSSNLSSFIPQQRQTQVFTANGTATVPSWAKEVLVSLVGGGAGGSSGSGYGGGGGGGCLRLPIAINGAASISVTVGAAGTIIGNGGDTSITLNSLTITGKGGITDGAGGACGSAAGGAFSATINGAPGTYNGYVCGGGGATGSATHVGGAACACASTGMGGASCMGYSVTGAASVGYGAGGDQNHAGTAGIVILEFVA